MWGIPGTGQLSFLEHPLTTSFTNAKIGFSSRSLPEDFQRGDHLRRRTRRPGQPRCRSIVGIAAVSQETIHPQWYLRSVARLHLPLWSYL